MLVRSVPLVMCAIFMICGNESQPGLQLIVKKLAMPLGLFQQTGSFRALKPQTVIIALIWCKWEGKSHNQTGHAEIQSTIQKFNICRRSLFLGANSLGNLVVQDVMDSNLGLIESFPCACEMICLILK